MSSDDNQHQLPLVPHVYQGNLIQQRASDGYINATAMCKAAGKEWSAYRRNSVTDAFLTALEGSLQIHRDLIVQSIVTGDNDQRGTWVHPQIAIHLAQWLSPEFSVQVTEWVYDWMSGKHPSEKVWQQFQDRVSLVYDNVPVGYFCVFRELAEIFASLISNGATFGTKMLLDISVGQHWAIHWKGNELASQFGERAFFDHYYPGYFPQSFSNPQESACYPEAALPTFRRWLREVYVPVKMPDYLKRQVKQKKLPAQIANDTLAALEQRERRRALPRRDK
jgi:hypothetical protein